VSNQVEEWRGQPVVIPAGTVNIEGTLVVPPGARGLVLFAHGSGSSRHSPRNRFVADYLNSSSVGTLLFDLLSEQEEERDAVTSEFRFDLPLLAKRLLRVIKWASQEERTQHLNIGLFGSSTGAGAALLASTLGQGVKAIVSRGGRPDAAGEALANVVAPTLLIVGGDDELVLHLNERAAEQLPGVVDLKIIPGATHLFEEPGALEEVSRLASEWFHRYLTPSEF